TGGARLFRASPRPGAHDQNLAAEHAVSILLFLRSVGLPRYADSEGSDNDDGRGSFILLSDNKEGVVRLSLSDGAIGLSTRSFWSSAKNCVRLQSRSDSAARELTKIYRCSNIVP